MPDQQKQQQWGGWDAHIRDQLKVLEERRDQLEEDLDAVNEDISEGKGFLGEDDDSDDMPPAPSKQRDAQAAVTQHQQQPPKAKPKR